MSNCPCGYFIFADTEDWEVPLCYECYLKKEKTMSEKEKWVPVKGYEGAYEVSDQGNIKSFKKERTLKPSLTPYGYLCVSLRKNSKSKTLRAHRIVAQSFIPNPEDKPYVNHKNGNKKDNRLSNLEWVTAQENLDHATATGLFDLKGEKAPCSVLRESEVLEIIEGLSDGFNQKEISEYYNISHTGINKIAIGRAWTYLTGIKYKKDQVPNGEDVHGAKLSAQQVVEIFNLTKKGFTNEVISKIYPVTPSNVSAIKTGRVWCHVTGLKNVRRKNERRNGA